MATTVGTTTQSLPIRIPTQRQCFYANGRFWVFYIGSSTTIVWRTSTDGVNWSDAQTMRVIVSPSDADDFSVWFDGTYLHYAYASSVDGEALYYRMGTPESNGNITWADDEQTVLAGAEGTFLYDPTICTCSDGYPMIGYHAFSAGANHPYINRSSTKDGTWTDETDYPYSLSATGAYVLIIPLTSGKWYAVWCDDSDRLAGKLWDGSSWGDEETSISSYDVMTALLFCGVADGDDVHIAYQRTATYDLLHLKRTYGVGWGSENTIQAAPTSGTAPALSIDTSTSDIYCFWLDSPTNDHVYYKKYSSGAWDADPTDWIDETTDGLWARSNILTYYQDYGTYIATIYKSYYESPYKIRHDYLTMAAPAPPGLENKSTNMAAKMIAGGFI